MGPGGELCRIVYNRSRNRSCGKHTASARRQPANPLLQVYQPEVFRNLIIRDSNSPLFYLSQPARIKLCKECKAPMKYVRIDYDRRVFRGKAPTNLQLPDHDELLAYISRIKQSARS
jgi:hypothetical protein